RAVSMLLTVLAALGCASGERSRPAPLAAPAVTSSAAPPALPSSTPAAAVVPPRIASLACGDRSTCVLLGDGTARCWGTLYLPRYGDPVDPAQAHSATPVPVAGLHGAAALALGTGYACAITGGAV